MLEIERRYFEQNREKWIHDYPAKYLLIKGEEVAGAFDNTEEALTEGSRRYGLDSFLIRQVEETEKVVYIPALSLGILRADSTHSI